MASGDSVKEVLVIAGLDSSGGAGVLADVRAIEAQGLRAQVAVTAVTAQTDRGVEAIHHVAPEVVEAQIAGALGGGNIKAIKIGMLGCLATVEAVARGLRAQQTLPLVIDPVLASSSGTDLLDSPGREALVKTLFPAAALVTPNVHEAGRLLDDLPAPDLDTAVEQARRLLAFGSGAVLLKGGHLVGPDAVDVLAEANGTRHLASPRLSRVLRGTGCALASAIAGQLALGRSLETASVRAKNFVRDLIETQGSGVPSVG